MEQGYYRKKLPTSLFFFEVGANTKKNINRSSQNTINTEQTLRHKGVRTTSGDRPYGETINTKKASCHLGVRRDTWGISSFPRCKNVTIGGGWHLRPTPAGITFCISHKRWVCLYHTDYTD